MCKCNLIYTNLKIEFPFFLYIYYFDKYSNGIKYIFVFKIINRDEYILYIK